MLGFDPWAAASLGLPSLIQGHVPLPPRLFSSVDGGRIGIIAVFLKSLPELTVICKFSLEREKEDI